MTTFANGKPQRAGEPQSLAIALEIIENMERSRAKYAEALAECREYFEDLADAEYLPGDASPTGNDEMRLLVKIDAILGARR